jgi:hypothetical protein
MYVDGLWCVPRVRTRERVECLQYNVKFFSNGVVKRKMMDISTSATFTNRRSTYQSHPHHPGAVFIPSDLSMQSTYHVEEDDSKCNLEVSVRANGPTGGIENRIGRIGCVVHVAYASGVETAEQNRWTRYASTAGLGMQMGTARLTSWSAVALVYV